MPLFLLRIGLLLAWLLAAGPAAATHLMGGEMSYEYLDASGPASAPLRYRVTVRVYQSREPVGGVRPSSGNAVLRLWVLDKSRQITLPNILISRISLTNLTPAWPASCSVPSPRTSLALYRQTVNLPYSADGYSLTVSESARNLDVSNLDDPGNTAMVLSIDIAPPSIRNAPPVFADTAVVVMCLGDTAAVLNNAIDPDGDRLEYAFGTPNTFGNGFPTVAYQPNHSATAPFGPGGYASLDAATGLGRYRSVRLGKFVVAVDVREYRTIGGREVLLSTLRRDIQLVVLPCGTVPTRPPAFTVATPTGRLLTVAEGEPLVFPIAATEAGGQPLLLKVVSSLLDGPGGTDAAVTGNPGTRPAGSPTGFVVLAGPGGSVTGSFRFVPGCGMARPAPYEVAATVNSDVCGGKSAAAVFRIVVTPPPVVAPRAVRGDSVLCAYGQGRYTADGPVPPGGFGWTVRGGTIEGPATGATVLVRWHGAGAARLAVSARAATGCPPTRRGWRCGCSPAPW